MPVFSWSAPARTTERAVDASAQPREGVALEPSLRAAMERGFGHDFGAVRVYADEEAYAVTRAASARALTIGNEVALGRAAAGAMTTAGGRHTLAHELAHVVQQSEGGRAAAVATGGHAASGSAEREADTAATRVLAGGRAQVRERRPVSAQCQGEGTTPTTTAGTPAADPGQVLVGGLSTIADQAKDNNPEVRRRLIEPLTLRAGREFGRLSGGEQAGLIGFGAGTLALSGGALLSDPNGRRVLSGVNLATPLTLIPGMPLTHLSYTLPSGQGPTQRIYGFQTNFSFDDLLEPVRRRLGWQGLTLSAEMAWAFDPVDNQLRIREAHATLGILPGVTLSGGAYPDLLAPRQIFPTAEGGSVELRQQLPAPAHTAVPDVRVILSVDLLQLGRSGVIPGLRGLVGSF
ncbi:eCIS core domain-containing protein [Monashia sp. NPDC004114]